MSQRSRDILKTFFEKGDFPTSAQFIDFIDSVLNFTDDGTPIFDISDKEEVIERPSTQPVINAGVLIIDLNSRKQGIYEPRKSVGTLSIDENFTWAFDNEENADLANAVLSLSGTREITFPADVLVSNASTIGTWTSPVLTLETGTDNIITFSFLRYKTNSKWELRVGEVAI